jgi:methionine aminopeptidase
MEINFGVLIGGWIVDYAWTIEFNPNISYDPLLEAIKEVGYFIF